MEPRDILKLRKKLNLTQVDMCKALDVHINTYRSWEYGGSHPSKDNIEKLREFAEKTNAQR